MGLIYGPRGNNGMNTNNKCQGMDNTFTWGCCENCTKLYRDWNTGDNDYEDSVVVEIKYNDDREDYYNYPVIH